MTEKVTGFVCGGKTSDHDKRVIINFIEELSEKDRSDTATARRLDVTKQLENDLLRTRQLLKALCDQNSNCSGGIWDTCREHLREI
jgi:hypothetical protein